MAYRPSPEELADLLKKNPALKIKVDQNPLKAQRTLKEFIPVVRDEKTLLEAAIQAAYFEWVLNPVNIELYPNLNLIYAIPNGSNKSKTERWLHQATGLRSGVPDVHIAVSVKPFFSFYIEFKRWAEFRKKDHGCSENQLIWHDRLRNAGHRVDILWSVSEAIKLTKEYLRYG